MRTRQWFESEVNGIATRHEITQIPVDELLNLGYGEIKCQNAADYLLRTYGDSEQEAIGLLRTKH